MISNGAFCNLSLSSYLYFIDVCTGHCSALAGIFCVMSVSMGYCCPVIYQLLLAPHCACETQNIFCRFQSCDFHALWYPPVCGEVFSCLFDFHIFAIILGSVRQHKATVLTWSSGGLEDNETANWRAHQYIFSSVLTVLCGLLDEFSAEQMGESALSSHKSNLDLADEVRNL